MAFLLWEHSLMNNPFLLGKQVYLRPLELADAPLVAPWLNDPEVSPFLLRHLPISLKAEEEYIANMARSEQDVVLGIVLQAGDRLIGATGFHQIQWKNR